LPCRVVARRAILLMNLNNNHKQYGHCCALCDPPCIMRSYHRLRRRIGWSQAVGEWLDSERRAVARTCHFGHTNRAPLTYNARNRKPRHLTSDDVRPTSTHNSHTLQGSVAQPPRPPAPPRRPSRGATPPMENRFADLCAGICAELTRASLCA
jgi:hypothetical protein